ncbi:MAG: hypothetical protein PHC61_18575, partial [Chitinivibrionales bacterium]|nr:hypothetical protein [Chitinivibrionales bacterium]
MRPVFPAVHRLLLALILSVCSVSFGQGQAQIEEYVLQAGDVISISVIEHPEFSGRHKIRPD